ncbi:MAG: ABC-type transport auxiliary lipoprotein family protein [Pseudoxanthomonas sp.]
MKLPTLSLRTALVLGAGLALSACGSLLGGGGAPTTIYAPQVQVQADAAWPRVDWSLAVASPSAPRIIDSTRIAVRPVAGEIEVYKGAAWAQSSSAMLQGAIVRTLEDSGRMANVAASDAGIRADYRLVTDIRRFEADYAGASVPAATIEVSAKLVDGYSQRVVASRVFAHAVPAAGTDIAQVADAFGAALSQTTGEIAGWVLTSGRDLKPERP